MNYQQTVDFLFSRLPMFSRVGLSAYKKDLTNIKILCEQSGNPHNKFKSIHVAGTNGKGSVSHMLAAVLQTAGYKTGLHTSPHLRDFRERIKVNGKMCDENFIVESFRKTKSLIEEIEPSFFEISVSMAFEYFAQHQVDIAVVETGLGGRLDSTNILLPEISVITNIGKDHMHMLGDTLEKIAFEKAGIIKEGIPVVVGEYSQETAPSFEKLANEKKAPLVFADKKRQVTDWKWENYELIVEVAKQHRDDRHTYHLDLCGLYQTKNLLSVLETAELLHEKGWKTNEKIIQKALPHVKKMTGLHGRWEVIHQNPTIILDAAHNEDGIKQIVKQIEITDHTDLHIIIGMVKDKEIENILQFLPKTAMYYFTQANIPRALDAEILKLKAETVGLRGTCYLNVNVALQEAFRKAANDDLILVCGSIFLIGEVEFSR